MVLFKIPMGSPVCIFILSPKEFRDSRVRGGSLLLRPALRLIGAVRRIMQPWEHSTRPVNSLWMKDTGSELLTNIQHDLYSTVDL